VKMHDCYEPKVLILLATYNGMLWLEEQLESITKQTGVRVKILISDDHSDDGSLDSILEFIESNSNAEMITSEKSSGSAGQNFFRLIRNCDYQNFDYIAFSDQDDVWLADKLVSGIECLKSSSVCGYSSATLAVWESGKERLIKQAKQLRNFDFLFEGAGQGCTFILKHDFFGYVQEFCVDNKEVTNRFYYHDWLVYILARASHKEWFFDERSFIRYRQHSTNDTGAKGSLEAVRNRLKLIKNGWFKAQISIALEISKLVVKQSVDLDDFGQVFYRNDSLTRRLILMKFLVVNGRRKTSERMVLATASLLGWI